MKTELIAGLAVCGLRQASRYSSSRDHLLRHGEPAIGTNSPTAWLARQILPRRGEFFYPFVNTTVNTKSPEVSGLEEDRSRAERLSGPLSGCHQVGANDAESIGVTKLPPPPYVLPTGSTWFTGARYETQH